MSPLTQVQVSPLLFLTEKDLFPFCEKNGTPLHFSLSSLRKDRLDQRLGGLPHRRHGRTVLYSPLAVLSFIQALPVVQGRRPTQATQTKKTKPTKVESVHAARAGLSVADHRSQTRGA